MTTTRFTKEQLIARAREKVKSLEFAVTQTAFAANRAELEEERELARIALASFEAEPVAWQWEYRDKIHVTNDQSRAKFVAEDGDVIVQPLYTAQPVSVVPEAPPENLLPKGNSQDAIYRRGATINGWRLCRAAMLQGKAEPVSNRDELPLDYLQGHKDGLEWAAQLAEANHPQTGDWLYDDPTELAKAIRKGPDMPEADGNYPVIPDGYALVPKRLTAENFAKAALSGEFSETKFINCPECFGDDECETCDGSGRIEIMVPVSWNNIKAIWDKGIEHFSAAPQQEVK
ncbi:hypothetical protein PU088_001094 [Citrobacter farmeri]|nr:hypothetical protein [Citrobacter farmeri]